MVRLSCGVQCTRTVLLVLNILFVLLGLTLVGVGIYARVDKHFVAFISAHTDSDYIGVGVLQWVTGSVIVLGVCTILLSSFGCWGALCKNRCLLYTYAIILVLLVLLELAAFIVTLNFRNDILTGYDSTLTEVFNHAYRNNQTESIALFETLERDFECCGVKDFTDYYKIPRKIPASCYKYPIGSGGLYYRGCANAILNWAWNELPVIGGVLGAVFLLEIFGVIAAIALGVAISHSSSSEIYYKL